MAKIKILTREELQEIKKEKAKKKAKAWLINQEGVCTHIPKSMALVPYKEKKEKLGVISNNPNLQFFLGIGFIIILYLIGCYNNNLERVEFLNSALEVIAK